MSEEPNPLETFLDDQLILFNVAVGPDMIEIDFLDPRRQAKGFTEITKLGIERDGFPDEIEDIEERIRDLVDEALRHRRK